MCATKYASIESSYEPIYDIVYYGDLDFLDTVDEDLEYEEEESEGGEPELYLPGLEDDTVH